MASLLDRFDNIRRIQYGQANAARFPSSPLNQHDEEANIYEANAARFASSPLNRNAYGGEAGYQYRRLEESYGRALRQLRRAARRGDTGAALQEIAVRERAMEQGFTPGGIRDRREFNADREAWQAGNARMAADARMAARLNRRRAWENAAYDPGAGETGPSDPGAGETGPSDPGAGDAYDQPPEAVLGSYYRTLGGSRYDPGPVTVNPAANPGPGYGQPISRRRRLGDAYDQPPEAVLGSYYRTLGGSRY
jgi:hypothetical protein